MEKCSILMRKTYNKTANCTVENKTIKQREVKMKVNKQNENSSLSLGQKKRLEKKKEVEKAKRNARLGKIISYSLITLIAAGLVTSIGYSIYRNVTKIKPSSDFSAYLSDDGLIKDVSADDFIELVDYKNITAPLSEIQYSDEAVDSDIKSLQEQHKELIKDTDGLIKDGDQVNIDYVGTVDGVVFSGGTTEGNGADLVIGANVYVDDFEAQLIGHKAGDKVTVNVTFPTDYSTNKDVAGKDAVFEVVINGIYNIPDFTDDFVKENLSEHATTVAEYREYLKQSNYDKKLDTWLEKYLLDKTTVKSYPTEYYNHLKSLKKYEDQVEVEYMNNMYASMGYNQTTFESYVGMSEAKYDANLKDAVTDRAKKALLCQSIYKKEGLSVSKEDYSTFFDEDTTGGYDALVEEQGVGYVMQQIIEKKVLAYVKNLVVVK